MISNIEYLLQDCLNLLTLTFINYKMPLKATTIGYLYKHQDSQILLLRDINNRTQLVYQEQTGVIS